MKNYCMDFRDYLRSDMKLLEGIGEKLFRIGVVTDQDRERWMVYLSAIEETLLDVRLRIAVVGSVKSGKSTLINALLGRDMLKRGAGIITAFVTRVVSYDRPEAWITLKSVPQASRELERTMKMLPDVFDKFIDRSGFDIGREEDRKILSEAVDRLRFDVAGLPSVDISGILFLIQAYLDGFNSLGHLLGGVPVTLTFNESNLLEHQAYVGNESHAVYVQDMELHYPIPWLDNDVEIADCQGSDALNPLHFALLQEYLFKAHLIIYVINSRTGLREADVKLLEFIRTLNMLSSTICVLNVDIDVHPSQEDLISLEERVRRELSWMVSDPRVFTFSALAELIKQMMSGEENAETQRLTFWHSTSEELLRESGNQFKAFRNGLVDFVTNRRLQLLTNFGATKLKSLAASIHDLATVQYNLVSRDFHQREKMVREIEMSQKDVITSMGVLENMVSGLRDSLVVECDKAVQRFFDLRQGSVVRDTMEMIEHYHIDSSYQERFKHVRGLVGSLYDFYINFRKVLSRFLVEHVNVQIMTFAHEQEGFLRREFSNATEGFWALLKSSLKEYRKTLKDLGIPSAQYNQDVVETWEPSKNIVPPNFSTLADDHIMTKGALFTKYSVGRMSRFLRKLKGKIRLPRADKGDAYEDDNFREAVLIVKRQVKEEMIYVFRDYRQNFRFQYLHRLIDDGIAHILREFRMKAGVMQVNLQKLHEIMEKHGAERENIDGTLKEAISTASAVLQNLESIQQISFESLP